MNDYSSEVLKLILSDSRPQNDGIAEVRRSELYYIFKKKGYAERTIKNHLAPSNKKGMVFAWVRDGVFIEKVCLGWRVDVSALKKYRRRQDSAPKLYCGAAPSGDEWSENEILNEFWRYSYKQYSSTGFNFKLFALKSAEYKANFWLRYDKKKFKPTADLAVLIDKNKELYSLFLDAIERDERFN